MKQCKLLLLSVLAPFALSCDDSSGTDAQTSDPGAEGFKIEVAYVDTLPTVLLKTLQNQLGEGPVDVTVTNSGSSNANVTVSIGIQDYTSAAGEQTLSVPAGETVVFSPAVFIDPAKLPTLTTLTQTNYQVKVTGSLDGAEKSLFSETHLVNLMARDAMPWVWQNNDLKEYVALFVTPTNPSVQSFLSVAKSYTSDNQFVGYQSNEETVTDQASAIFNALKDHGITYSSTTISFPAGSQKIRFPADALAEKAANCIDGTVLMASALEAIGIEPLIVLVPGHAFLGWNNSEGSAEATFLETTMIGSATFEEAVAEGLANYEKYSTEGTADVLDVKSLHEQGYAAAAKRIVLE